MLYKLHQQVKFRAIIHKVLQCNNSSSYILCIKICILSFSVVPQSLPASVLTGSPTKTEMVNSGHYCR